jgi:tripartite-type tricarboxylate transporter receptor subunit TctC
MSLRIAIAAIALVGLTAAPAPAQDFPTSPVRLVVGFAPGGGTDVFVRLLAPYLAKTLGQQVLVENRTGANGAIANEFVAKAAPDGHTLLISTSSVMGSGPHAAPGQPVNPVEDLEHVTMLIESPYYVVGSNGMPYDDLAATLEAAKSKPGSIGFGSQGVGGMGDIIAKMLELETGAKLNIVQYRGGGAVATDLLANQVQLTNFSSQMIDSYYPSGQVRGLMVLAAERSPVTPDIPSSAELGYENLERLTYWAGLHAPKGTPPETIDKLHAAVVTAFENPELRERIEATGQTPVASTPAKFSERVRADYDFYGEIFEIADIPVQ